MEVVIGDSANRIRRTRECRELATLLTGLPLPLALWLVVSIPLFLSFHIPLNLISVFPFPAFTSSPLLLHLPAFRGQPSFITLSQASQGLTCYFQPDLSSPVGVPSPFPTLCLSPLFRSQALWDICFTVSAGDTKQGAFARRSLGTLRIVTLPLKADSSSDGGSWGCSGMNDPLVPTGMWESLCAAEEGVGGVTHAANGVEEGWKTFSIATALLHFACLAARSSCAHKVPGASAMLAGDCCAAPLPVPAGSLPVSGTPPRHNQPQS